MKGVMLWVSRGTAIFAIPAILGVELIALFSRGTPWRGEWAWTIDWANGATILGGPVLAGVVAFDVQRVSKSAWLSVTRGFRRGQLLPLHVAVASWACATAIHFAIVALAGIMTATTSPTGRIPFELIALGPIVLAAFAGIGMVFGAYWPSVMSSPAAVIVAFLLTYAGAAGIIPKVFRVGGTTGSLVGLRTDYRVLFTSVSFLVALALLSMIAVALRNRPMVSMLPLAIGGIAVLVTTAGLADLKANGDHRFQLAVRPPPYICAGRAPQVCLAEGTTRQLPGLAAEMNRQASVLQTRGIALPTRFVQDIPGRQPPTGEGVIIMATDQVNRSEPDRQAVAAFLATPAACEAFYQGTAPPEVALRARVILADVIRARMGIPLVDYYPPGGEQWIRGPGSEEWLRSTYKALRECDLENVQLPS
jgi:hypothetical protein